MLARIHHLVGRDGRDIEWEELITYAHPISAPTSTRCDLTIAEASVLVESFWPNGPCYPRPVSLHWEDFEAGYLRKAIETGATGPAK